MRFTYGPVSTTFSVVFLVLGPMVYFANQIKFSKRQNIMPNKPMKKPIKKAKSVKFDESSDEDVIEAKINDIPTVNSTLIPFHLPLILYGMFKYGLTSNTQQIMIKGYMTLLATSIVHSYVILRSTVDRKEKKKSKDNVVLLIGSSLAVSMMLSVPVMAVLILCGSPVSVNLIETFYLANHLSVLIFNPILTLFKLDFNRFVNVFKLESFYCIIGQNPVLLSGFLSMVGTWIGVIPIPLDWDRPWQNWPITLLVGGYIGSFIGPIVSLVCN